MTAQSQGAPIPDKSAKSTADLGERMLRKYHLRLSEDDELYVHNKKVYVLLRYGSSGLLQTEARSTWSTQKARELDAFLKNELLETGKRLHSFPVADLLPVENGLLDVSTGTLVGHSPDDPAWTLLPVKWDPAATCPTFDEWIDERCGDQAEVLLEAAGLMLVPSYPQRRAVFLFGPSRSGKSTFLRLLRAVAGKSATTNVSLADMEQTHNRFRVALLYGKLLNVAPDLSDMRLRDLSVFKQLTGGDDVTAEKKYAQAFTFTSQALHVFSANTLPEVTEQSSAFMNRVVPVQFPHTFEGSEDPSLEEQLMLELPGILVRLVEGAQRVLRRGGYPEFDPRVMGAFSAGVDPVALFVGETLDQVDGEFLRTADLMDAWEQWHEQSGRKFRPERNKLYAKCEQHLGPRTQDSTGSRGWRGWKVRPQQNWGLELDTRTGPDPAPGRDPAAEGTSTCSTCGKRYSGTGVECPDCTFSGLLDNERN